MIYDLLEFPRYNCCCTIDW